MHVTKGVFRSVESDAPMLLINVLANDRLVPGH